MAFPQGIDFRATSGFVTDPTGNYAELTQGNPSGNYPTTTPQGNTVGFVSSDTDHRDRQVGNDPRIAGTSFPIGGGPWSYRIDLPAAGSYDIFAGLGDGSYSATVNLIVLDNGSAVYTLGNVTTGAGNSFADISGAVSVAASWPSAGAEPSGNKITKTFASTIAQFTTTGGAVCHLFIQAAGGGGTTIALGQQAWHWNGQATALTFDRALTAKAWNWHGQAPALSLQIPLAQKAWHWAGNAPLLTSSVALVTRAWNWAGNGIVFAGTTTLVLAQQAWVWAAASIGTGAAHAWRSRRGQPGSTPRGGAGSGGKVGS